MSSKPEAASTEPTKKKFGKETRTVPHPSEKAKNYYPAEDEVKPRKVRKSIHPTKLRPSLSPGTVLILLAGRYRGKRVILLKHLEQGVLLVTGPFKINGVPLRRVNSRYVIATSMNVELKGLDSKTVEKVSEKGYFTGEKKKQKASEEAFFKQGEKPEKKKVNSARANDQKSVDKPLLTTVKKVPHLFEYLQSTFSLRNGDRPHEMKW
ncbi:hypothetical protein MMC10_005011 [Thelotrema lepadinum]|nr:hypothetical protein [Thelotrema lepadinum]